MYNLHSHSLLSDGSLLPSEVATRFLSAGYKVIAITDHVDYSNIEPVVKAILYFTRNWPKDFPIKVLPGVELTHLPLNQFKPLAKFARSKGIEIIVAHGETVVEPVIKGTNRAALEADIDILAHPGFITDEDIELAKQKNIFLEITARKGHRDTNPHVAAGALKIGAKLILSLDSHDPQDIIRPAQLDDFALSSGLETKDISKIHNDLNEFLRKRR